MKKNRTLLLYIGIHLIFSVISCSSLINSNSSEGTSTVDLRPSLNVTKPPSISNISEGISTADLPSIVNPLSLNGTTSSTNGKHGKKYVLPTYNATYYDYLDAFLADPLNGSTYYPGNTNMHVMLSTASKQYYGDYMKIEAVRWAIKLINEYDYLRGFKINLAYIYYYLDQEKIIPPNRVPSDLAQKAVNNYCLAIINNGPSQMLSKLVTKMFAYSLYTYNYGRNQLDFEEYAWSVSATLTQPSDIYRIGTLISVLRKYDANYVGVFSSFDAGGAIAANEFKERAEAEFCFPLFEELRKQHTKEELVATITYQNKTNLKTLIFFTDIKDTKNILDVLTELKLFRRFLLIFVFASVREPYVLYGNEEILHGAISMDYQNTDNDDDNHSDDDFKDYYLNYRAFNKREQLELYHKVSKHFLRCFKNFSTCKEYEYPEEGYGYYPQVSIRDALYAINIFAYRQNALIRSACSTDGTHTNDKNKTININGSCYLHAILERGKNKSDRHPFYDFPLYLYYDIHQKTTFIDSTTPLMTPWAYEELANAFDIASITYEKGSDIPYSFKTFGVWNMYLPEGDITTEDNFNDRFPKGDYYFEVLEDFITYPDGSKSYRDYTRCSRDCLPGYWKKLIDSTLSCCWECIKCPANHYSEDTKCIGCEDHQNVDTSLKKCNDLPIREISYENTQVLILLSLSFLGVVLVLIACCVFYKYRYNRLFGDNAPYDYYGWLLLSVGVVITLASPALFFFRLTVPFCLCRLPVMAFGMFACSMFSTVKLMPFFDQMPFGFRIKSHELLVLFQHIIIIIFGLVAQVLITFIPGTSTSNAMIEKVASQDKKYAYMWCSNEGRKSLMTLFSLSLITSVFSVFQVTTKFVNAKNRYENRYLIVCCLTYVISFIVYVSFHSSKSFTFPLKTSWLAVAYGWFTIITLIIPKAFLVCCCKQISDLETSRQRSPSSYPTNPLLIETNANVASAEINLKSYDEDSTSLT